MPWLNLPNALTFSRLVLAPFAVRALVAGEYRRALALFFVAACTDGIDGYLARKLNARTRVGAYLDPIADKVLLTATYLALGLAGQAPWWMVGLVFGRDLLILLMAAAALLFTRHRDFPPSAWGKLSTFLQILAASAIVISLAFPDLGLAGIAHALLWPMAAGTAWSGIVYIHRGWQLARRAPVSTRA